MSLHRRGDLPFRFGRLLRRRTYPQEALKGLYEYSPLARASAARGAREFLRVLAAWLVWPSLRASMLGPPMCALAMSVDKSEGSSESSISERTLAAVEIAMRVQNDHPQFWASAFLTHLRSYRIPCRKCVCTLPQAKEGHPDRARPDRPSPCPRCEPQIRGAQRQDLGLSIRSRGRQHGAHITWRRN